MSKHLPIWLSLLSESQTKAERALPLFPDWYQILRQRKWSMFCEHGFPDNRSEHFKYHDFSFLHNQHLSFSTENQVVDKNILTAIQAFRMQQDHVLLVFVDGYFSLLYSDLTHLPGECSVHPFPEVLFTHADFLKSVFDFSLDESFSPFTNLNTAFSDSGVFIHVPDQYHLSLPIHVLSFTKTGHFISQPKNLILLGEGSRLDWIEEHIALGEMPSHQMSYLVNQVTQIQVGKYATLNYCKIQNGNVRAVHVAQTYVKQMEKSKTFLTHVSVGSALAREEICIELNGLGANCSSGGLYRLAKEGQCIDHHVEIKHFAPDSQSEMLHKGILDESSRGIFNGRLWVGSHAEKIKAYQANHNILLSDKSEIYSKPELEIYAEDVQCKHAATIGQIDPASLFYLRSRGIKEMQARAMLLCGFVEEIIKRVVQPDIKTRIEQAVSL